MKPGDEFQNAQGAVDLFGLIGQVIRPQGGQGGANTTGQPAAAPASAAATPAAPADPYPGGK